MAKYAKKCKSKRTQRKYMNSKFSLYSLVNNLFKLGQLFIKGEKV